MRSCWAPTLEIQPSMAPDWMLKMWHPKLMALYQEWRKDGELKERPSLQTPSFSVMRPILQPEAVQPKQR